MRIPSRYRRADATAIGWISTADTLLYGFVVLLVVGLYLNERLSTKSKELTLQTNDFQRQSHELSKIALERDTARVDVNRLTEQLVKATTEEDSLKEALKLSQEKEGMLNATLAEAIATRESLKKKADELSASYEMISGDLANITRNYQQLSGRFEAARKIYLNQKAEIELLRGRAQKLADTEMLVSEMQERSRVIQARYDEAQLALVEIRKQEGRVRQELIGLRGKMRRVVIVLDSSASMKERGRWDAARDVMKTWLDLLDMDQCALVVFGSDVTTYPGQNKYLDLQGTQGTSNRAKLVNFLANLEPKGGTNTLRALERAYDYPNVDTIVLFTDGAPNDGNSAVFDPDVASKIYKLCEKNKTIPINAVGLGDYFQPELSSFLLRIAETTNGTFLGR